MYKARQRASSNRSGIVIFTLLPMGSIVVPFCGLYLGSYKVIPKWNYYGACGYVPVMEVEVGSAQWRLKTMCFQWPNVLSEEFLFLRVQAPTPWVFRV